jgi:hypothetical protein
VTSIVLNLNTRILQDDHQVFVTRPGKDYRLYPEFLEQSVVLLELPGLTIPEEISLEECRDLRERILMARRVRNWHQRGRPESDIPSRDF